MSSLEKPTACILCECNCGLLAELGGNDGRRLLKVTGDRAHPASRGYACEKAHRLDHYQNGRDLLTEPLRRRPDGTFEKIDWETAIREVSQRLSRVRDEHSGDSIFYYGGGGQGNHLPGAYSTATRRALGSRYRSSALAQEKTGEFWISDRVMGSSTRADFEHCDVALFLGKNPWQSHSIPRARVTLKTLSKDPARTLIVVDPRRTESAELADIHLQLRPGTDAWMLTALLAVLVEEELVDQDFVSRNVVGAESLFEVLKSVRIAEACAHAGLPESLLRRTARVIGGAKAFSSFEDLGVQMSHHSTVVSYLHRALIALTGNFGKPGTHFVPTVLVPLTGGASRRTSPVVSAPSISGLIPCNAIADEILCDHPKRYRAMIVEAANPAHSLADSPRMRQALRSLDTLVVIDCAMSETAALADYVLPAATQFEKAEATFFNFEFPHNTFHLRQRLFAPEGARLPEAEIHSRLVEALEGLGEAVYKPLRDARAAGLEAYAQALMPVLFDPKLSGLAPVILYRTAGLEEAEREGAVLLGIAFKAAMENGESLARAGFTGTPMEAAIKLFEAILSQPSGVVFAVDDWAQMMSRLGTPDKKFHLDLPDMIEVVRDLAAQGPSARDSRFPFVLSAGERRSYTANTIIRDPMWRKKDADIALRICPSDAEGLGVVTGDRVALTTSTGSAVVPIEVSDTMQPGHVSLPNGLGVSYPSDEPAFGSGKAVGVAPNELTASSSRDPFVGTPWHKHVPARVERA